MRLTLTLAAALSLASGAALADVTDAVIAGLTADGYTRIEIQRSPDMLKVEAIRGDTKLEQIIDRSSGAVLKQEVEPVRPGEDISAGLELRDRDRIGGVRGRGRGGDDDGEDDHGGHGDDDGPDHDLGDDHGGHGGDDGPGHDSGDDSGGHGGGSGGHGGDDGGDHDSGDDSGGDSGGHGGHGGDDD